MAFQQMIAELYAPKWLRVLHTSGVEARLILAMGLAYRNRRTGSGAIVLGTTLG
jgi:hypothetical protein